MTLFRLIPKKKPFYQEINISFDQRFSLVLIKLILMKKTSYNNEYKKGQKSSPFSFSESHYLIEKAALVVFRHTCKYTCTRSKSCCTSERFGLSFQNTEIDSKRTHGLLLLLLLQCVAARDNVNTQLGAHILAFSDIGMRQP